MSQQSLTHSLSALTHSLSALTHQKSKVNKSQKSKVKSQKSKVKRTKEQKNKSRKSKVESQKSKVKRTKEQKRNREERGKSGESQKGKRKKEKKRVSLSLCLFVPFRLFVFFPNFSNFQFPNFHFPISQLLNFSISIFPISTFEVASNLKSQISHQPQSTTNNEFPHFLTHSLTDSLTHCFFTHSLIVTTFFNSIIYNTFGTMYSTQYIFAMHKQCTNKQTHKLPQQRAVIPTGMHLWECTLDLCSFTK